MNISFILNLEIIHNNKKVERGGVLFNIKIVTFSEKREIERERERMLRLLTYKRKNITIKSIVV